MWKLSSTYFASDTLGIDKASWPNAMTIDYTDNHPIVFVFVKVFRVPLVCRELTSVSPFLPLQTTFYLPFVHFLSNYKKFPNYLDIIDRPTLCLIQIVSYSLCSKIKIFLFLMQIHNMFLLFIINCQFSIFYFTTFYFKLNQY